MFVKVAEEDCRRVFVRLDPGEELVSALGEALASLGPPLESGSVTGIGSVRRAVLGYYDLGQKKYLKQQFDEVLELVCLAGNVSLLDGRPFVHAHAVLSGPDYLTRAGHLFQAEIAATGELWVWEGGLRLARREDPFTGLKLISGD